MAKLSTGKASAKRNAKSVRKNGKNRRSQIIECDMLASQVVRLRDGACVVCGRREPLFCHHIYSRGCHSIRHDLRNLVAICWACHRHVAHEHPERFRDIIIGKIGLETYLELKHLAYAAPKSKVDYEAVKKYLIDERHDLVARQAEELF